MPEKLSLDCWETKIDAAQASVEIYLPSGRIKVEMSYASGFPTFVVLLESQAAEGGGSAKHFLLPLESLPDLVEHAAHVLAEVLNERKSGSGPGSG